MKPVFNLYELDDKELSLEGEVSPDELELQEVDELIHVPGPLSYRLQAQRLGDAVLVRGEVRVVLVCECARCLESFETVLEWPDWTVHLELHGEDAIKLVDGAVDLTPFLREDTLLRFPQHPLCKPECGGLAQHDAGESRKSQADNPDSESVWAVLNQLKLK